MLIKKIFLPAKDDKNTLNKACSENDAPAINRMTVRLRHAQPAFLRQRNVTALVLKHVDRRRVREKNLRLPPCHFTCLTSSNSFTWHAVCNASKLCVNSKGSDNKKFKEPIFVGFHRKIPFLISFFLLRHSKTVKNYTSQIKIKDANAGDDSRPSPKTPPALRFPPSLLAGRGFMDAPFADESNAKNKISNNQKASVQTSEKSDAQDDYKNVFCSRLSLKNATSAAKKKPASKAAAFRLPPSNSDCTSSSSSSTKTPAQKRFEEAALRKVNKNALMSHKDRVAKYNKYLANLSEHHDIPRVRKCIYFGFWFLLLLRAFL